MLQDVVITPRIAGGFQGGLGAYPFHTHAFVDRLLCSGTLIAADMVLTAKSCDRVFRDNEVYLGSNDLFGRDFAPRLPVAELVPHPYADLLLVLLNGTTDNTVVLLNDDNSRPDPTMDLLFTMGFGKTARNQARFSDSLREVDMFPLDNDVCRLEIGSDYNGTSQLCASFPFGGPCDGDEGGPLLDIVTQVQYGVYSYNLGCTNQPAVYTRVSPYVDWIDQAVCERSARPPNSCNEESSPTPAPGKGSSKKSSKSSKSSHKGSSNKSSRKGSKSSKMSKIRNEIHHLNKTHYFYNETHHMPADQYNNTHGLMFVNVTHHFYNETHYDVVGDSGKKGSSSSGGKGSSRKSGSYRNDMGKGGSSRKSDSYHDEEQEHQRADSVRGKGGKASMMMKEEDKKSSSGKGTMGMNEPEHSHKSGGKGQHHHNKGGKMPSGALMHDSTGDDDDEQEMETKHETELPSKKKKKNSNDDQHDDDMMREINAENDSSSKGKKTKSNDDEKKMLLTPTQKRARRKRRRKEYPNARGDIRRGLQEQQQEQPLYSLYA